MTNFAPVNKGKCMNLICAVRNRHFFMFDVLVVLCIPIVALALRLDTLNWRHLCDRSLVAYTAVALPVKLCIFNSLGLYRRFWRYASTGDLARALIAVGLATGVLTAFFVGLRSGLSRYDLVCPQSLPLLDGLLTCLAIVGVRAGLRALYHWFRKRRNGVAVGRRVLVVGAGDAGIMSASEMRANPQLDMEPLAFVDDDPAKVGTHIHGLPVLGTCGQVAELVSRHQIQRIIVAMPAVSLKRRQEIIKVCRTTGVPTYSLPGIYELLAGYKTLSSVPQIDVDRLLHREPIQLDQTRVTAVLRGAKVLITGAGGSIGSELCRQIARLYPSALILLGHGESSIFQIGLSLHLSFPDLVIHQVIADVRDRQHINQVVEHHRPDVIFHAAAHKHVPMLENCVEEALSNNTLGTRNVVWAAERYGVERLVLISTDKAVCPVSVMGATKRLAELLVKAMAQRSGRAYMVVRFGNVLGSRGSVVPVFQQQIAAGGPLTVTHPDMCRYFMTIPEAVELVLQASGIGQGGETFVLEMGQPIRILDLALDLINLSGLKPGRDIDIVYTGIRPGERLYETLFLEQEKCQHTDCQKVWISASDDRAEFEVVEQLVIELVRLAQKLAALGRPDLIRALLFKACCFIDDYQLQFELSSPELSQQEETGESRALVRAMAPAVMVS